MAEKNETRPLILVASDFSECSRAALARGIRLARGIGGTVLLLHVVDTSGLTMSAVEQYVDVVEIAARMRASAEVELREVAAVADPERQVVLRVEVTEGRPAASIVEHARAEKADTIVVGTHGRTGLSRLVIGSVAERVVRLAPCDVLVVHAGPC
jgi:universal stress protein A